LGIAACLVLAAFIIWSVRQSRLTREALDRATSAEQTAAQARSDLEQARAQLQRAGRAPRDPAVRRSQHDDPAQVERVKELHQEIEGLTQIREQVDEKARVERMRAEQKSATLR
jgi:hypothetical protein